MGDLVCSEEIGNVLLLGFFPHVLAIIRIHGEKEILRGGKTTYFFEAFPGNLLITRCTDILSQEQRLISTPVEIKKGYLITRKN